MNFWREYRIFLVYLGRSLIYNKNKIGPKTDPCGTPDFIIELFEKEFSSRVIWDLFDKKL